MSRSFVNPYLNIASQLITLNNINSKYLDENLFALGRVAKTSSISWFRSFIESFSV